MPPPEPQPPAREAPIPSLRGAAALAALALGLVGCSSIDARIHNLEQLHHEDGKISYRADLVGDSSYVLRDAFRVKGPFGLDLDLALASSDDDLEFIDDPAEEPFEVLLSLDEFPLDVDRYRLLRTEMYLWLLNGDPFVLTRELCARELGPIGRELGVTAPLVRPEPVVGPTPDELAVLITDLIQATGPVMRRGGTSEHKEALRLACEALRERDHDMSSGRRVLRVCSALADAPGSDRAAFDPVHELGADVARRLITRVLTKALDDPSPYVKAATLEAWIVATDGRAGEFLLQSFTEPSPLVLSASCRVVERYGLPQPASALSPQEAADWEDVWYSNLIRIAVDHPDGEVSAAACRALAATTGAGIETLRFEEWADWWVDRMEARQRANDPDGTP